MTLDYQLLQRQVHIPNLIRPIAGFIIHNLHNQTLILQLRRHTRVHKYIKVEVTVPLRHTGCYSISPPLIKVIEPEEDQGFNLVTGYEWVRDVAAL